jgi:DNA-binding LacI/PurR family transcriptional regulator
MASGIMNVMNKDVTSISDIARLAGVSASTVSRALAGNKMISLETRTRINDLAREHGFQLNQLARNLRLKRSQAIGVVVPVGDHVGRHMSDPFFVTMLGHIADGVTGRGFDLLLTRTVPSDDGWLDALVNSGRVDGVIVIGQSNQIDMLERIAGHYRPLVVWGQHVEGHVHCSVGTDAVRGGAIATKHLLDSGRRRIVFAGIIGAPSMVALNRGFADAHRKAGVAPAGVIPAPYTGDEAFDAIVRYLAENPAPDGIVAASDIIAMSAIRALASFGLSVPGDVSVVGYDDVPLAAQITPALTTVRQDLKRGANQLIDMLFQRLDGELTESVVMKPELVVRASAP